MSSTAGATHRPVPVFSSSQASSRSRMPLSSGHDSTATVSAPKSLATAATRSRPLHRGDPADFVRAGVTGQAGGHDGESVVSLPAQLHDDVRDHVGVPGDDDLLHERAEPAQPVQPLAQRVPGRQVEDCQRRERHDDVAAGELRLGRVGDERDPGRQDETGVQHPAELIGTDSDEPGIVAVDQRHDAQPAEWQQAAGEQVYPGRAQIAEAHVIGKQAGQQRAQAINCHGLALITYCPF